MRNENQNNRTAEVQNIRKQRAEKPGTSERQNNRNKRNPKQNGSSIRRSEKPEVEKIWKHENVHSMNYVRRTSNTDYMF
jgi:hypothetical protein